MCSRPRVAAGSDGPLRVDDLGLLRHRARGDGGDRAAAPARAPVLGDQARRRALLPQLQGALRARATRSCASASRTARGRARRRSCPRSSPARWPGSRSPSRVTGSSRGASSTSRTSPRASSARSRRSPRTASTTSSAPRTSRCAEVAETVRDAGRRRRDRPASPAAPRTSPARPSAARGRQRSSAGRRRRRSARACAAMSSGTGPSRRSAQSAWLPRGGHAAASRADRRADGRPRCRRPCSGWRCSCRSTATWTASTRSRRCSCCCSRRCWRRRSTGTPGAGACCARCAGPGSSPRSCRSWCPWPHGLDQLGHGHPYLLALLALSGGLAALAIDSAPRLSELLAAAGDR